MSPTIPASSHTPIARMTVAARLIVVALAISLAAAGLSGCAPTGADDGVAIAKSCEGLSDGDCEASDNARQLRDAAAYQNEPELGYVNSPPGMLPMPTTSRNPPVN